MPDDDLHVVVARLDERINAFTGTLKQMADDQSRLTDSYEKLVESNQRIALVETDVMNHKASLAKLWEKWEEHEREHKRITGHALYEVLKLTIAVAMGVLGAHIGMPLAGQIDDANSAHVVEAPAK